MTLLSKIRVGLLSTLILSTTFTALPAQAEPTPHTVTPSITEADIVTFDANGTLWAYSSDARIPDDPLSRRQVGSGWTVMRDLKTADWNQDGIQDIVAVGKNGNLYVYYGAPAGGFTRTTIGTGWGSYDISVVRWKVTDAYPSIIAVNSETGALYNYPNLSGSVLSPRVVEGSGWGSITHHVTDWDGDADADILGQHSGTGNMILYRTNGNGNFIDEPRIVVGRGWNVMNMVESSSMLEYPGLMARTDDGNLYLYQIREGRWLRVHIGTGWNGYTLAF
ncbi:hypothetical protein GCM10009784_07310 [Arthrobacter parietis]|uniref:VCBS repeat-containing protein n=1 Tax=Arthrobacter parietis TaxID=271434 RepID=A0ABN3AQ50_9MICC